MRIGKCGNRTMGVIYNIDGRPSLTPKCLINVPSRLKQTTVTGPFAAIVTLAGLLSANPGLVKPNNITMHPNKNTFPLFRQFLFLAFYCAETC